MMEKPGNVESKTEEESIHVDVIMMMIFLHMLCSSVDFQIMFNQSNNVLQIVWCASRETIKKSSDKILFLNEIIMFIFG